MMDDIILNAVTADQQRKEAYEKIFQRVNEKILLADIHKQNNFSRDQIQGGIWVSSSSIAKKKSSHCSQIRITLKKEKFLKWKLI